MLCFKQLQFLIENMLLLKRSTGFKKESSNELIAGG